PREPTTGCCSGGRPRRGSRTWCSAQRAARAGSRPPCAPPSFPAHDPARHRRPPAPGRRPRLHRHGRPGPPGTDGGPGRLRPGPRGAPASPSAGGRARAADPGSRPGERGAARPGAGRFGGAAAARGAGGGGGLTGVGGPALGQRRARSRGGQGPPHGRGKLPRHRSPDGPARVRAARPRDRTSAAEPEGPPRRGRPRGFPGGGRPVRPRLLVSAAVLLAAFALAGRWTGPAAAPPDLRPSASPTTLASPPAADPANGEEKPRPTRDPFHYADEPAPRTETRGGPLPPALTPSPAREARLVGLVRRP